MAFIRPRQDLTIANLSKMLDAACEKGIKCRVLNTLIKGKLCVVIEPLDGASANDWLDAVTHAPGTWWNEKHFQVIE